MHLRRQTWSKEHIHVAHFELDQGMNLFNKAHFAQRQFPWHQDTRGRRSYNVVFIYGIKVRQNVFHSDEEYICHNH